MYSCLRPSLPLPSDKCCVCPENVEKCGRSLSDLHSITTVPEIPVKNKPTVAICTDF